MYIRSCVGIPLVVAGRYLGVTAAMTQVSVPPATINLSEDSDRRSSCRLPCSANKR